MVHLALFRLRFVEQLRWIDAGTFDSLASMAQVIPGPSSSQVGFALGARWQGFFGGAAAFFGFTLPSAVIMGALGLGVRSDLLASPFAQSVLRGFLLFALACLGHALWSMGSRFRKSATPWLAAVSVAVVALVVGGPLIGALLLLLGLYGASRRTRVDLVVVPGQNIASRRSVFATVASTLIVVAVAITFAPGLAEQLRSNAVLTVAVGHFQAGALVFGGGHVVMPLLKGFVVSPGLVDPVTFAIGYGAAQAIPGPMFTFAAFLGAAAVPGPWAVASALLSLFAIFLPGLTFILAAQGAVDALAKRPWFSGAIEMLNAGVLGLLAAALIQLGMSLDLHYADALVLLVAVVMIQRSPRGSLWACCACVAYALARALTSF